MTNQFDSYQHHRLKVISNGLILVISKRIDNSHLVERIWPYGEAMRKRKTKALSIWFDDLHAIVSLYSSIDLLILNFSSRFFPFRWNQFFIQFYDRAIGFVIWKSVLLLFVNYSGDFPYLRFQIRILLKSKFSLQQSSHNKSFLTHSDRLLNFLKKL